MSSGTKMKWSQKLKSMSVEPASFFFMASTLLGGMLMQNLQIEAVCTVTRNNSIDLCREIVKNDKNVSFLDGEEVAIQQTVADVQIYSSIGDNVFKLLFVLIAGPWSDRCGRRAPLILTIIGNTITSGMMLGASFFYDRMNPYWMAVMISVSSSVLGGEVGFTMSAYGHLCDITDTSSRTFRTGIYQLFYQLGVPVGYGLVGVLIRSEFEYTYALGFGLGLVFSLISLGIVMVGVKEEGRVRQMNYYDKNDDKKWKENCSALFQIFKPLTKPKSVHGKVVIWLIIALHVLATAPIHGDSSILYLFLRQSLSWDVVDYGYFSLYAAFLKAVGVSLGMAMFTKWLRLSDPVIGFISGWSELGAGFIYAFAVNATTIYLGPAVAMINLLPFVIARSMLSKVVGVEDIGKAVSLTSVLEAISPLVFIPLYSWMYGETVAKFSGTVFLFSAGLTVLVLLIYLWFIFDTRRYRQYENRSGSQEDDNSETVPILGNKT